MKIPAPDLDRVIQNVLLYADKKAIRLQEVLFVFAKESLEVFSCDDYITLTDSCSLTEGILSKEFALAIEDVEKLGDWIKKDKKVVHKYDITIRPKMTGLVFECDETSPEDESDDIFLSFKEPAWELWDLVLELLSEENPIKYVFGFATRPERLAKLARIKADKEAPIDFRGVDVNDHLILQFKKGLTVRGAMMPVKRDVPKEEFLW